MNDTQVKELLKLKGQIAQASTIKSFNAVATEALKWAVKNLPNDKINKEALIRLISESRNRILTKKRKGK